MMINDDIPTRACRDHDISYKANVTTIFDELIYDMNSRADEIL